MKTNLISGEYVGIVNDTKLKPNNIIHSLPTFTVTVGSKIIETLHSLIWHTEILKPIDIVQFEMTNEIREERFRR